MGFNKRRAIKGKIVMAIEGIILAAGYSSRAGDFKPALDLYGRSIIRRSIESMLDLCDKIIVVGGHRIEKLKEAIGDMPNVKVVKNKHVKHGMFSSARAGVSQVEAERFFILPGDQPLVLRSTYEALLDQTSDIVIPRYKGKKGHPVLFNGSCKSEILAMPDTEILRNYIHAKNDVAVIDVNDPGIGMDVDTPEDYERVKAYYREHIMK
jgi:molybdenum cofactor cytidylyltransferase